MTTYYTFGFTTYLPFMFDVLNQDVAPVGASYKAMLLTPAYSPDRWADHFRADIDAHECTGTGYTAGGIPLTVDVLGTNLANGNIPFTTPDDITFAGISVTAQSCAVYLDTGDRTTDVLVAVEEFDTVTVIADDLTLPVFNDTEIPAKVIARIQ